MPAFARSRSRVASARASAIAPTGRFVSPAARLYVSTFDPAVTARLLPILPPAPRSVHLRSRGRRSSPDTGAEETGRRLRAATRGSPPSRTRRPAVDLLQGAHRQDEAPPPL